MQAGQSSENSAAGFARPAKPRFGIDIGGTFTDLVVLTGDGTVTTAKVPSTPHDYAEAIVAGLTTLLADCGLDPAEVGGVVHGTTIATNTILESRGALTGLVTTRGFRDVLEMRRLRIPQMYNLQYTPPAPLVARRLRLEVDERMGPRGEIWTPLDEASVEAAASSFAREGVAAVTVALINSYANPLHEKRCGEILAARLGPQIHLTLSSTLLPEIREYERTSTAVVNAYVGPVVRQYLADLDARLKQVRIVAPLKVMQSNGGVMSAGAASKSPAHIIESGPAAGVMAAASISTQLGLAQVISFDMGGTTAKAALIEAGVPAKTSEFEVGAGINLSSKLIKGGGHAVKLPYVDISEIGAGGGSLLGVDEFGAIRVGPRSAGSRPGPACYGLGGSDPTFTDAMVVLGYLNPEGIAGGTVRVHADLARAALDRAVAAPLAISLEQAAWGAYSVAASHMTRAVKAVSTYRGRDPRDSVLLAFGGNGPLAALAIARTLRMKQVLIPPACGVLSAFGLLCADTEHSSMRTIFRRLDELPAGFVDWVVGELQSDVERAFAQEATGGAAPTILCTADLRYAGQAYELTVPFAGSPFDPEALAQAFAAEHHKTYGYSSAAGGIDLVSIRVTGKIATTVDAGSLAHARAVEAPAASGERRAYFGPDWGLRTVPVIRRSDLTADFRKGPIIIEEYDTTIVVPPDASAAIDSLGNVDVRLDFEGEQQ